MTAYEFAAGLVGSEFCIGDGSWPLWLKLSPICETVCLLLERHLLVMQGWHHLVARVLRHMKLVEMASWAGTALQYWKCDIAWRKAALRSYVKDVLHTADNLPTFCM